MKKRMMGGIKVKKFFSIFINPKKGCSVSQVEDEMNKALDWFRLNESFWVVYSSSDIDRWMGRLKKLVDPDGSLFICELNIENRNGWMTENFWTWIKEKNTHSNS
ncbi:MAG: hypothetical protein MJY98_04580 [Fibrobacter sp.]|nr:hypothetical protein [Fibrobacter sp.]